MKKWEEERRQKQHAQKITKAKPTIKSQPPKGTGAVGVKTSQNTQYGSSKGFNVTNSSVSTKVARLGSGVILAQSDISHQGEMRLKDLPIFQLLKAFKLQQYAKKLDSFGYGDDLYKLALLNEKQREDLVQQLKVLPGHKAKLMGLFSVIDEIYPKNIVAEQLKQFTPAQGNQGKGKRLTSAKGPRGHVSTTKSLLQQYESLDAITKQAFNETFLANLESVKYNMGQLISQHVNKEESKQAINMIFPPSFYGIGQGSEIKGDENYNKEIESLLNQYSQKGAYPNFNNKDALEKCVGHGQARDLKKEMNQAMKDIKQINIETGRKKEQQTKRDIEESIKEQISMKDIDPLSDRPMSYSSKYEVYTDDKEKSQVSYQIPEDSLIDISESQLLNDAINILNDTKNLNQTLKEQYEQVAAKEQKKKEGDVSMLNPLAQGDDSKLNATAVNIPYEKQQVYEEKKDPNRPLSPLLDKAERDKAWNLGQSLNSKQVTSALGYLDLKQICYCLAHAVMKHIEFSQGQYFLDELQEKKKLEMTHIPQGKELEFTYNLDQDLKIDIEKAKQRKQQKEEQSKIEFEKLKQQMEKTSQATTPQMPTTKLNSKNQILEELKASPTDEVQEEVIEDNLQDDEGEDGSEIQDYYEDIEGNKKGQDTNEEDEHIDFDYSQTHLDDFLKSQTANNLLKGSNVQSSQLINTFLTSYNKMRTGTMRSMGQTNPVNISKQLENMQAISENNEPEESERNSEYKGKQGKRKGDESGEDEEDLGRSVEKINLQEVDVVSKGKRTPSKPILSKEEVEKVKKEEESKTSKANLQIDVQTKKGFKEILRFQMRIFDQNYDFQRDELIGGESMYLGNPTLEELYYYYKYVIISGRMEKEIPILCLVYLERFLMKTGVLINHANWKRLSLICLLLASKIWDDDSLENVHFPQVMPDITLKEITSLEKVMLSLLDYDLVIRGAEYAKYYFILKTFSEKFNSTLPMGPLSAEQMIELQNNTLKAESNLREKYNVKLSLKKTM